MRESDRHRLVRVHRDLLPSPANEAPARAPGLGPLNGRRREKASDPSGAKERERTPTPTLAATSLSPGDTA